MKRLVVFAALALVAGSDLRGQTPSPTPTREEIIARFRIQAAQRAYQATLDQSRDEQAKIDAKSKEVPRFYLDGALLQYTAGGALLVRDSNTIVFVRGYLQPGYPDKFVELMVERSGVFNYNTTFGTAASVSAFQYICEWRNRPREPKKPRDPMTGGDSSVGGEDPTKKLHGTSLDK